MVVVRLRIQSWNAFEFPDKVGYLTRNDPPNNGILHMIVCVGENVTESNIPRPIPDRLEILRILPFNSIQRFTDYLKLSLDR